jgi:hypothetical protein
MTLPQRGYRFVVKIQRKKDFARRAGYRFELIIIFPPLMTK